MAKLNHKHSLEQLIRENDMTQVAELGLKEGKTFLYLLKHCPKTRIIGVDMWAQRPEQSGVDGGETYDNWNMAAYEAKVREGAEPYGTRARILKMSTTDAARFIGNETLDLVFIDADHSENGVTQDILNWAPKVRPGGIVSGHDINWPSVKRAVDRFYPSINLGHNNLWWVRK